MSRSLLSFGVGQELRVLGSNIYAQTRETHFRRWFKETFGDWFEVSYPDVPLSLVFPLYEPQFVAHENSTVADCLLIHGDTDPTHFRCRENQVGS